MDKISIVVPVYNVEKYLHRCIDSIINQTYKNLEIILVDDGSPDNCGRICDEYALKDDRIKVIHQQNGGLSEARNVGIDIAEGKYIAFIDSDDYIEPNMYEKLYVALKNTKSDVSICSFKYEWETDNKRDTSEISPIKDELLDGKTILFIKMDEPRFWYWVVAWNKLYKKTIWNELRFPVGKVHEDEFVIHEIYSQCNSVACISDELVHYVQRDGSIMNCKTKLKNFDYAEALVNRLNYSIECGCQTEYLYKHLIECISSVSVCFKYYKYNEIKKMPIYNELCNRIKKQIKILIKYDLKVHQKIKLFMNLFSLYYAWRVENILDTIRGKE